MNTLAVTPEIRGFFSVITPVALWIALLGCFFWVVWRTGSTHPIKQRIWQLVHGKSDISDPGIKAFVDERTSLMSFRFASGLRSVRTIERARRLADWLRANDEDVSAISRAGRYFDLEDLRVRDDRFPSNAVRGTMVILATVAALFALLPIALSAEKGAFLQITKSGTWFAAYPSAAKIIVWPVWRERPALTAEDCQQDQQAIAKRTQVSPEDVGVICKLITEASAPKFLATTVAQQRIALALIAIILGVAACMLLLPVVRVDAARELAKRLKAKQSQSEFEL